MHSKYTVKVSTKDAGQMPCILRFYNQKTSLTVLRKCDIIKNDIYKIYKALIRLWRLRVEF